MALSRAEDVVGPLLTYCAMCRDRLRGAGKPAIHMLSLLFPQEASPEGMLRVAHRTPPGFSERQEGRLVFRRNMLHTVWEEPLPDSENEGPELIMDDAVTAVLEQRRILRSDIRYVLQHKETTLFSHAESGRFLACLRPRQVTFWVEYSRDADDRFCIHDAYCHRMVVPGVPDIPAEALAEESFSGCRIKDVTGCGQRRAK